MISRQKIYLMDLSYFFFFNDTATTEIYTLSLHDALPISGARPAHGHRSRPWPRRRGTRPRGRDRKSTHLNSSHLVISYAVFCLKKKNQAIATCRVLTTAPRLHDAFPKAYILDATMLATPR